MRDRAATDSPHRTVTVDIPVTILSTLRRSLPPTDVDAFIRAAVIEQLARDAP
ncbi:hypothetical protein [Stackebrandtia soli]|uniref:hypothetical protein n=1 Tax=Stackebrandtia soli TaxID=1892856 RepID=UPI0039E79E3F